MRTAAASDQTVGSRQTHFLCASLLDRLATAIIQIIHIYVNYESVTL